MLETPLAEKHRRLGARMAPFGGWLMPIQYTGIIEEHLWTRSSAGLFDICHMGEFFIDAEASGSAFSRLVTICLEKMPEGACRYGFLLDESGGIIDDLVVYRIGRTRWMAVVNAATTAGDGEHFRSHLPAKERFENVSGFLGKLDLQGPRSSEVLSALAGPGVEKLKYYTFGYFNVLGEDIIISRTGYTGELGYELYMPNAKIPALWDELLSDSRVKPVGLGARDTLRVEMGYSLYGQDLDRATTPVDAGYERIICWDKDFIGKEALLRRKGEALSRAMIYFMADGRRSPRHNHRIFYKDSDAGFVTSGSFSPSLGVGIGMGYVSRKIPSGEEITIKDNAVSITAKVVDKPFLKRRSL